MEGWHIDRRQENKWKDSVNQRLCQSIIRMSIAQIMLKVTLLPKHHIFISLFIITYLHSIDPYIASPLINNIPYFSIDNAHLMYNAHPKLMYTAVCRACSFFTNLDLFCRDNARVIYRKIR